MGRKRGEASGERANVTAEKASQSVACKLIVRFHFLAGVAMTTLGRFRERIYSQQRARVSAIGDIRVSSIGMSPTQEA